MIYTCNITKNEKQKEGVLKVDTLSIFF